MRLLLIALQAGVAASVYAVVISAVAAPAPTSGGNALYMVFEALMMALQVIAVGTAFLPVIAKLLLFVFMFVLSIMCAVLCGYRIFRWARWVGIFLNLALACICFFYLKPGQTAGESWIYFKSGVTGFFLLSCYLFYVVPKRPDVEKNRRVIAKAHFFLFALPVVLFLAAGVPSHIIPTLCVVLLVYSIPFWLNAIFTRSVALQAPWKRVLIPVTVSLLFILLSGLLFPPLAVPIALSLFLFAGFLEMLLLYPSAPLAEKNWRYYAVKLLGRLPEDGTPQ